MTAREFVARLRRRWYVLVIFAFCTMGAVWAVHQRPISYLACDDLFVTAPTTKVNPNVYTNEAGSLDTMTGLVTRAVMSQAAQDRVRSKGLTAGYDAEMTNTGSNENPLYGEPSLQICSTSTDPVMAIRTMNGATRQFQMILYQRQAAQHVTSGLLMRVEVVASPAAVPIDGRPSQAYLGVAIMGLVSGVAVALWTDPLLERLRRRKTRGRSAEAVTSSQSH